MSLLGSSGAAARPDPPGAVDRAFTALLESAAVTAPIAAVDHLRRRWLRHLGGVGRALVLGRELRVAATFSLVITTALIGCVIAPLWLLILGPLIWGVGDRRSRGREHRLLPHGCPDRDNDGDGVLDAHTWDGQSWTNCDGRRGGQRYLSITLRQGRVEFSEVNPAG